jgi:hypothetical protein
LPWDRERTHDGLGIPYVDYKRGDGLSIGVGQERPFRLVVIDDETPWVRDYAGLWGLDTEDRFGGERGPAGPRYERDGRVRRSWADPVGWAALDAVVPSATERSAVVVARLEELTAELATIDTARSDVRARLRAAVVGGATDTMAEEAELAALAERAVLRRDEHRRLCAVVQADPAAVDDPGPHAHLRSRPVPIAEEPAGRRRFLRAWATVSTPLVLALIGVLFTVEGWAITTVVGLGLLGVFTLEAVARQRLVAFVINVAMVMLVGSIALALIGGLIASWRLTVGVVVFGAALAILVANLRELVRT